MRSSLPAPWQTPRPYAAVASRLVWPLSVLPTILRDRLVWLILAGLAILAGGSVLGGATVSFFVDTQSVTGNQFTTGVVNLTSSIPATTIFNLPKLLPGDIVSSPVTIANPSAVGALTVPYYLTVALHAWAPTGQPTPTTPAATLLDSDTTNGVRMVVFRCSNGTVPVSCDTATYLDEVSGVTGGTHQVATDGNRITAAGISVSAGDLVFTANSGHVTTGATITGRPILTASNSSCTTYGADSIYNACQMGGPSAATLDNPAMFQTLETTGYTIPGLANIRGLAPGASDYLLVYAYLPATAGNSFQNLSQQFVFGFTAVQPAGLVNPSR